jgi:hypothetical protein
LIETRRTSSARPERAARRFRAGTVPLPGQVLGALADGRRIRAILVGSGLAGLLGATACAVASVSAWLVPVYLLLVVVILAAPRGPRTSSLASGSRAGSTGTEIAEPGRGSGTDRADGTGLPEPRPDAGPDPGLATGEGDDPETAHLRLDPAATAVPKPRRSRARSRKPAKPAAEPTAGSAPVTWVRVGPGQYVRSDTLNQGQPPAQTEAQAPVEVEVPAVAAGDDPATDPPAPAPAAPTVSDQAAPAADVPEAETPTTSEEPAPAAHPIADAPEAAIPTPEADAPEAHPAPDVSEPVPTAPEVVADTSPHAEEYGIAPSAFSTTAPESEPAESREPVVPDPIEPTPSEPEPVRTAVLVANATATGPDGDWPDGRRPRLRSRMFPRLFPRGIANASPATETRAVASLRRSVRGPGRPRTPVRCSTMRDPRREAAARRAFGRTEHVRRDWRARSPPPGY